MDQKDKKEKLANYIVNNINFGQAIQVLIEKAKRVANYMINNNCKKEDFHLYLFDESLPQEGDKIMALHEERKRKVKKAPQKKENKGLLSRLLDAFFPKNKTEEKDPDPPSGPVPRASSFKTKKE
jgi:hypothetical protein